MMINHKNKNSIKSVKPSPGADVASNHNPSIAKIQIQLQKLKNKPLKNQIDLRRVANIDLKKNVKTYRKQTSKLEFVSKE